MYNIDNFIINIYSGNTRSGECIPWAHNYTYTLIIERWLSSKSTRRKAIGLITESLRLEGASGDYLIESPCSKEGQLSLVSGSCYWALQGMLVSCYVVPPAGIQVPWGPGPANVRFLPLAWRPYLHLLSNQFIAGAHNNVAHVGLS